MTDETVAALVRLAELAMALDEEKWPADDNYLDPERDVPICYYCDREVEGALREVDRHHAPTCPWGRLFDALREVRRLMDATQLGAGLEIQADDWEHVKGGIHGFPGVPFARVHAYTFLMAKDPVDRYRPALDGMFRLKESHDRFVALLMGLAELTALPELFMVKTDKGVPSLNADGTPVMLGRDSLSAYKLPDGYTIESMPFPPPVDPPSVAPGDAGTSLTAGHLMASLEREVSESPRDQLRAVPQEVASYLAWRRVIPWRWLQSEPGS